jgi:hypothetical protein
MLDMLSALLCASMLHRDKGNGPLACRLEEVGGSQIRPPGLRNLEAIGNPAPASQLSGNVVNKKSAKRVV